MNHSLRSNEPIKLEALPSTQESVLAHRLIDRVETSRLVPFPWIKVVFLGLATAGALAALVDASQKQKFSITCLLAGIAIASLIAWTVWQQGLLLALGLQAVGMALIFMLVGGEQELPIRGLLAGIAVAGCVAALLSVLFRFSLSRTTYRVPYPPLARLFRSWNDLTTALMNSPHTAAGGLRERDHLFLGSIAGTQKVLLLAIPLLMHHLHVMGGTGGGKTQRILIPLLTQLIRRRRFSIVYLDLKGDNAALFSLALEAAHARLNFRWFTLEERKSSYVWNFWMQRFLASLSLNERVQILLQALGIDAGEGYGRGYFSAVQERLVKAVMEIHPEIHSFKDLFRFITAPDVRIRVGMSQRDIENASNVIAVLARLESSGPLNATPDDTPEAVLQAAIDVSDVLSCPGVVYFSLVAGLEPTSARIVARLFVQSLVAAARIHAGERVDVVVVIDEVQIILGERNFSTILKQARDKNITLWMAHQNLSDLAAGDYDFTGDVSGNTAVKIICSARDSVGRDQITRTSGETVRTLTGQGRSITSTPNGESVGSTHQTHESIVPRIDQNTINEVNADDALAILDASPGIGFTQFKHPVIIRSNFHITKREFLRRKARSWPRPNRFTVGGEPPPPPSPEPPPEPGPPIAAPEAGPALPGGAAAAVPDPTAAAASPAAAARPSRRPRAKRSRSGHRGDGDARPAGETPASDHAEAMADYLRSILDEQNPKEKGR